jgi:hypothetical protein
MTSPAQPLYPHTLLPPPSEDVAPTVDVDALCDLFDRSGTTVMYVNTELTQSEAQALFDAHQLVAEFDSVRGVDGIRRATDDEIATAAAAAAAAATKQPAPKTTTTSKSST